MKFTVDVECTPEEARRFIGLPDMTPVHDAYLARLTGLVEQGITPDVVRTVMQSWSPMGETGMALWRKMFENVGGDRGPNG